MLIFVYCTFQISNDQFKIWLCQNKEQFFKLRYRCNEHIRIQKSDLWYRMLLCTISKNKTKQLKSIPWFPCTTFYCFKILKLWWSILQFSQKWHSRWFCHMELSMKGIRGTPKVSLQALPEQICFEVWAKTNRKMLMQCSISKYFA